MSRLFSESILPPLGTSLKDLWNVFMMSTCEQKAILCHALCVRRIFGKIDKNLYRIIVLYYCTKIVPESETMARFQNNICEWMIETWYKHEAYRRSNPFTIQFDTKEIGISQFQRHNQTAFVHEWHRFEDEIGPDEISTRLGYQHGPYTLGYIFDGPVSSVSINFNTGRGVYSSELSKIDVDFYMPDEQPTFKKMCLYTTKFPVASLDYFNSYDTLTFKNIRVFPKIYRVIVFIDSYENHRRKHGNEACLSAPNYAFAKDQFYSNLLKKGLWKRL